MTTLDAVVVPSTASVNLTVAAAPAGPVVITRTDANGTASVRLREGQEPISGGMIVQDYEASLVGLVTYLLVDAAAGTATDTVTLAGDAGTPPRIASIQLPSLVAVPEFVSGYRAGRGSSTVVHWPVDRGDPVVIVKPSRTREGRLTCHIGQDYEAAEDAADVAGPGRHLLLRQGSHAGMDMYFVTTASEVVPVQLLHGGWVWAVELDYVETLSPAVPLLGAAGWTFDDVTAGYPDFAAVRAAFTDYADLTIGPV